MPTTQSIIEESLQQVLVPGTRKSLVKLNLVRSIDIYDHKVDIKLATAALNQEVKEWLKGKVQEVTKVLPEVDEVGIEFEEATPKQVNKIGKVIAVMSGKGGVGKSLVTGLTAVSLARQGLDVGILDADITGPSIPKMFGISARPAGSENGILPVSSRSDIEIMSINLLLPNEDDAVIWRGPLIARAITQFWEEVLWGKLDYLVVDLPPGTADAPLTVMQSLPLSGVIVVFSPQDLAAMVVRKAVRMAQTMNVPILGLVENMSYLALDNGKRLEVFGPSRAQEMSSYVGAPLLAQFPIDPELARLCDEGSIERYSSDVMTQFADALLKAVPVSK